MEEQIRNSLSNDVINNAVQLYDIDKNTLSFIGGFENLIYEYKKEGNEIILRFVHSSHREYDQVIAELEFIDYLHDNNASVSKVIHSKSNLIVEKIKADNGYFSVSAFSKAPGTFVRKEDLNEDFFSYFGEQVGALHALTKLFNPKVKRIHWYQDNYLDLAYRNLDQDDNIVVKKLIETMETIKSYNIDDDSYGLIHTDLHFGNMYYHEKELVFFDFDDASYKHFISDIAIIIYYMFWSIHNDAEKVTKEVNRIMKPFMFGYNKRNKLNNIWFKRINVFLKLREIILYVVLMSTGEEYKSNERVKKRILNLRDNIVKDRDYLLLDKLDFYYD